MAAAKHAGHLRLRFPLRIVTHLLPAVVNCWVLQNLQYQLTPLMLPGPNPLVDGWNLGFGLEPTVVTTSYLSTRQNSRGQRQRLSVLYSSSATGALASTLNSNDAGQSAYQRKRFDLSGCVASGYTLGISNTQAPFDNVRPQVLGFKLCK